MAAQRFEGIPQVAQDFRALRVQLGALISSWTVRSFTPFCRATNPSL